jgi:putative cardiolipin synthase
MHNKAFIVDGAAAVIGGRNIGDEYFDATEGVNFRDMDAIVVGPVVREVAQIFDLYWNSEPSVPVEAFVPSARPTTDIEQVRTKLTESARTIRESSYGESVLTEAGELRGNKSIAHWAWGDAMFLADDPGKVTPDVDSHELHLAPRVREWLDTAHSRILLISPYFIPGDKGVAYIEQKRAQGIEVSVLTNSLASTDADAVYAAYASYLPKLLAAGVKVYELKPDAARSKKQQHLIASTAGQSSLHAKVMVVDDDKSFVGSMNLDPRSQSLNTEDGLLLTSPVLASELSAIFDRATDPEFTYEVLLEKGSKDRVYWQTQENGVTVRYDDAPRTSSWRRFKAGSTRLLPAEDML